MENIMIDIETLGTKPGCVILSISAVGFDINTGETLDIFHQNIDIDSSMDRGLKIEKETILWWLKQPKEAQEKITEHTGHKLRNTLMLFNQWIYNNFPEDVKVWGNSARFDFGILQFTFDIFNYKLPWQHYNERDVRSLVAFAPEIKEELKFEGIKHHGIDDCKHQIKYCSKIYQKINSALHPNSAK